MLKTFTGLYMDVENPQVGMINLLDIAHALSYVCRYAGHVPNFYSVAQHSLHCVEIGEANGLPTSTLRALLLHDATEAYMCDLPKSVKSLLPEYKALEDKLMAVIAHKYNITFPFLPEIKEIDILSGDKERNWRSMGVMPTEAPVKVKQDFLNTFITITL